MLSFDRRALKCAAALAAVLVAGCSSQQGANRPSATAPALSNVTGFPLYPGSKLVSSRAFTQTVALQSSGNPHSVFTGGNGTYSGHEVIAASGAAFSDLSDWLQRVNASPPPGYAAVETGANPEERTQAARYGLDYATFKSTAGGHTRGVLVIVMDPERVNQRFGVLLGMISKYKSLPAVMRGPIDEQAKSRIGMTLTQATEPDSPVGAALAALDQLEHKDSRGIVVLDATKH